MPYKIHASTSMQLHVRSSCNGIQTHSQHAGNSKKAPNAVFVCACCLRKMAVMCLHMLLLAARTIKLSTPARWC